MKYLEWLVRLSVDVQTCDLQPGDGQLVDTEAGLDLGRVQVGGGGAPRQRHRPLEGGRPPQFHLADRPLEQPGGWLELVKRGVNMYFFCFFFNYFTMTVVIKKKFFFENQFLKN